MSLSPSVTGKVLLFDKSPVKTAIITGASSGIGKALAEALAKRGYRLGLMARRHELLTQIKHTSSTAVLIQPSDFVNSEKALEDFKQLWDALGRVDYIFLNAGVSLPSAEFLWENDRDMLQVNAATFTALAGESIRRFLNQKAGHLIGVSSIAGTRGNGKAPVYGATKAYVSNYLQGLRQQVKAITASIYITDIRPGFVDTAMIRSARAKFWVSSPHKAALQILEAVRRKKRAVYVSRRWNAVALLYFLLPEFLVEKIYARYLKRKA